MERGVKLTPRGQQVAELVALGLSNKEIAQRIFLSERTVEWHVEQILNRLGFSSRSEIAAWVGRTQPGAAVRTPGSKRRGNLPAALTSFIGREREMAALQELMSANRLLTIVGPGGSGKTRLALRLAEELDPSFPDGAWLCDLAPVADPTLVPDAVAQALGISKQTSDRLTAVRDHLSARAALLVLDNCEHVLNSASDLARDLLSACRDLQVLATSLAPLGILGEGVWQLDPLPEAEAVRLFVERAKAAAPGFTIDDPMQTAMHEICERLDRLPLALELAAPRLRVLSLSELAEALSDATPKRRGDRHGSLAAVAAWGYETLDEDEQALFRRLSVFAGWFEPDDAATIVSDGSPLIDLVEKSMVVTGRTPEGRPRYRLLETLRVFARRRLEDAGELDSVRLAHAERMVWLAERLGLLTAGPERWLWGKAEGMVDDIRAALTTLLELQPRRAAWLAGTLRWFWRSTGRLAEGVRWDEAALEACPDACLERCWVLHGHLILVLRLGRLDETRSVFREATTLALLPECARMRGDFLLAQAMAHAGLGDPAAAEVAIREAMVELTSQGQVDRANLLLNDLAIMLLAQGRVEEGREVAEQGVRELRRANSGRIHFVLETLAQADCLVGQVDQARDLWFEVIAICFDTHEVHGVAVCLEGLAFAAGARQRAAVALQLHWCANHHLAQADDTYTGEPLAPELMALIGRLETEVGSQMAEHLRAQGEALTLDQAVQLAKAEG